MDGVSNIQRAKPIEIFSLGDLRYANKERTAEHLMTAKFSKTPNGVAMEVQAWRVRDSKGDMPQKDFKAPYKVTLR